ncbi:hypothetical protein JOB18_044675 [Solea senegalensis]|nr:182 kDa tankyrase-1-binding protein [Solea senegalensis]XP_043880167.1 182 kDa tankyrase-1-binding protein [Solea senegalensis]KAG7495116.1 hypothetical protein JOB18_044675 [Solea senegalensis]
MEPATETGHASNPKPPLAPKPRLTPKPFSLQKNTTFHSIHAPKTIGTSSKPTTNQTGKSVATGVPKPTPTARVQQTTTADSKPSSVRKPVKDKLKTTQESKASPHEVVVGSSGGAPGKSDPPLKTTPPEETPKSVSIQKDDVTQTNHKAATDDLISNCEQKDGKKKEDETQSSVTQKPEEPGSDNGSSTTGPTYQWGGTRKSLSTELTSMFESGGPALPVQPITTVSTNNTNGDSTKSVSPNPEQSQTTTEPSNRESDVTGYEDDYIGGGSIKRRISLLFDSSSRPEVMAKKEEPEIVTSEGGVKERIKHWAMETSSEGPKTERKPQVAPRSRSKSFEPVLAPAAEKTSKTPQVKLPATETSSTHTVDPHPKSSPEPPPESPMKTSKDSSPEIMSLSKKDEPTKPTKDEARLRSRSLPATQAATNEGDSSKSGQRSLRRDNVKRRSVRFGIVERDDGGPPLILGSASESSSEEEEEAPDDKSEEDTPVSFPVYRRAGDRQNKDDETQKLEEERLKHLEFEQRRRAEEQEQARLKLEEEEEVRKREEEEREKEHLRLREEEKHREEERERERLAEEEMERLRKEEWERERLKLEESEMRRQREEEMERERQLELMLQRQREEEQKRTRQREEKLKQEQIEREKERLEEERRREERLMVERERQRLREEEERSMNEHKEHIERRLREEEINSEKLREDQGGRDWVKQTESLRAEEEERDREREFERVRQKEERLKEEMEKERLREEAEEQQRRKKVEEMMRERLRQEEEQEKKRRAYEREMQQEEEEERERLRQIEKQKEEERVRHTERERLLEVERKMQAELEIQRVKELEEKLRRDQEKEKEILGLSDRGQKSKSDESSLISFDSEDMPQTSETPHSPFPKLSKPTENPNEVVYDDFSVKKSLIEVDFDDFSVKPKKWGSQAKAETPPVIDSWATSPWDGGKVDMLVPLDVSPQENRAPRYVAEPDDPEPTRAVESPEERQEDEDEEEEKEDVEEEEEKPEEKTEERQLISLEYEEAENKEDIEMEEEMDEEEEDDDNDKQETRVDYHHSNGEDRDVDALVDSEPEEQTPEPDSPPLIYDQVPEVSPRDVYTTNFHREPELAPFPESSTPLLDTSAQKSKATLSKRRSRSRPSRSLRAGFAQREILDWRSRDSTDENESSSKQRESDSEEEQPKSKIIYPPSSSSQRVPIFPGLSPTALIAQLKKRTAGGGEETEDKGSRLEETAPSPSLLSRSPRSAAHLAGAARVLPPLGGTDGGASSSPAWLKELKSKKRLGQHDSEL